MKCDSRKSPVIQLFASEATPGVLLMLAALAALVKCRRFPQGHLAERTGRALAARHRAWPVHRQAGGCSDLLLARGQGWPLSSARRRNMAAGLRHRLSHGCWIHHEPLCRNFGIRHRRTARPGSARSPAWHWPFGPVRLCRAQVLPASHIGCFRSSRGACRVLKPCGQYPIRRHCRFAEAPRGAQAEFAGKLRPTR